MQTHTHSYIEADARDAFDDDAAAIFNTLCAFCVRVASVCASVCVTVLRGGDGGGSVAVECVCVCVGCSAALREARVLVCVCENTLATTTTTTTHRRAGTIAHNLHT